MVKGNEYLKILENPERPWILDVHILNLQGLCEALEKALSAGDITRAKELVCGEMWVFKKHPQLKKYGEWIKSIRQQKETGECERLTRIRKALANARERLINRLQALAPEGWNGELATDGKIYVWKKLPHPVNVIGWGRKFGEKIPEPITEVREVIDAPQEFVRISQAIENIDEKLRRVNMRLREIGEGE